MVDLPTCGAIEICKARAGLSVSWSFHRYHEVRSISRLAHASILRALLLRLNPSLLHIFWTFGPQNANVGAESDNAKRGVVSISGTPANTTPTLVRGTGKRAYAVNPENCTCVAQGRVRRSLKGRNTRLSQRCRSASCARDFEGRYPVHREVSRPPRERSLSASARLAERLPLQPLRQRAHSHHWHRSGAGFYPDYTADLRLLIPLGITRSLGEGS